MKELLDKLTSYNLFNYFMPGIVFAVLAANITSFNLIQSDIVIGVFVYYFFGVVISRVGSLIIEPILSNLKIIEKYSYANYVEESKEDKFLEILLEVNNMYRTLCSLFFVLAVLKIYDILINKTQSGPTVLYILLGLFFVIFIFAIRKQTDYMKKRLAALKSRDMVPESAPV
jgi:magnesium-transporting ATPase (P-type)